MTLVLETGAGVRLANSYVTSSFVTSYLESRNRDTAWAAIATDAERDAYCVAATDYVDKRFGPRFRGIREFYLDQELATATVTFSGLPVADEALTVGSEVYTFRSALVGRNDVLIGSSAAAMASNLADAVNANADTVGTAFGVGTLVNRDATAAVSGAVVTLTATADGSSGNDTVLSGSVTNAATTAFSGGLDGGEQPLEFPRRHLYTPDGAIVRGIPRRLKEACAEYADRVRSALLDPDPTFDARGGDIVQIQEQVGPIRTSTTYSEGTHQQAAPRPYPAADRLLAIYLQPAGGAHR